MGLFDRRSNQTTAEVAASVQHSVSLTKGSGPAIDRATVDSAGSVNLTKRYDKAGVSLSKAGLTGIRAQVIMLLDHSYSMVNDYKGGLVQKLAERALGFALQVDTDGEIPIIAFDSDVYDEVVVTLNNYNGVIDREIFDENKMSGTQLGRPLQRVINAAKKAKDPIYLLIVTDGQPSDVAETTRLICETAGYPIFVKFLAIRPVALLKTLDDLGDDKRLLDNVDAQFIEDVDALTDLEFADKLVNEWASWIQLATGKGVLT